MGLIAWLTRIPFRMTTCHSPISSKTHSQSNLINFLRGSETMWPVAHERKSPVGKAAKVGVQIPFRANFFFCFF